jgi:hypothetical protein
VAVPSAGVVHDYKRRATTFTFSEVTRKMTRRDAGFRCSGSPDVIW